MCVFFSLFIIRVCKCATLPLSKRWAGSSRTLPSTRLRLIFCCNASRATVLTPRFLWTACECKFYCLSVCVCVCVCVCVFCFCLFGCFCFVFVLCCFSRFLCCFYLQYSVTQPHTKIKFKLITLPAPSIIWSAS